MTFASRIDVPTLPLTRSTLRGLRASDARDLQRHANNPNVARNLFDAFPQPYTIEAAQRWCEYESHLPEFGYVWGIEVDGEIVGVVGGRQDDGWLRCNFEIGYWLGESQWRRGIMSEAVGAVSNWLFDHRAELTRLYAGVFSWNAASVNVLVQNGYHREGEMKQSAIKDGRVIDRVLYAKIRPR